MRCHVPVRAADGLPQEAKSRLRSRLTAHSGSFEQSAPLLAQLFHTVTSVVQVSSCSAHMQPLTGLMRLMSLIAGSLVHVCNLTMPLCQPALLRDSLRYMGPCMVDIPVPADIQLQRHCCKHHQAVHQHGEELSRIRRLQFNKDACALCDERSLRANSGTSFRREEKG